jgi:hypothetical protein
MYRDFEYTAHAFFHFMTQNYIIHYNFIATYT